MIAMNDCKKGWLYRIHSRTLSYGVYDGKEGFIGLRDKFGLYLFTEYHYDQGPPYGTVKPMKCLEKVPDDIPIRENKYPTTVDYNTKRPVAFKKDKGEKYKGKWYFTDDGNPLKDGEKIRPCNYDNNKLLKWLMEKEEEYSEKGE